MLLFPLQYNRSPGPSVRRFSRTAAGGPGVRRSHRPVAVKPPDRRTGRARSIRNHPAGETDDVPAPFSTVLPGRPGDGRAAVRPGRGAVHVGPRCRRCVARLLPDHRRQHDLVRLPCPPQGPDLRGVRAAVHPAEAGGRADDLPPVPDPAPPPRRGEIAAIPGHESGLRIPRDAGDPGRIPVPASGRSALRHRLLDRLPAGGPGDVGDDVRHPGRVVLTPATAATPATPQRARGARDGPEIRRPGRRGRERGPLDHLVFRGGGSHADAPGPDGRRLPAVRDLDGRGGRRGAAAAHLRLPRSRRLHEVPPEDHRGPRPDHPRRPATGESLSLDHALHGPGCLPHHGPGADGPIAGRLCPARIRLGSQTARVAASRPRPVDRRRRRPRRAGPPEPEDGRGASTSGPRCPPRCSP